MDNDITGLLRLALDAASLRHQTIAHNIANAGSPGFTPLTVNFEQQLAFARDAAGGASAAALASVRPFVEAEAGPTRVMLDLEMVKLAQNTVHYQSLLKALDKRGAILSAAISEGRR